VSQESTNRSFDELARALAEGSISRRGALKLFAGTAIAALIPSRALAQQQKVTICHKPGTPDEQTIEVSQRAEATHLGHGDLQGPCCQPNGGSCSTSGECCSGTCSNGLCVCPTINCGAVGILNPNTCTCECDPTFPDLCENNTDPNFQGCCPTLMGTSCVPLGTVCSPPTS
jgi:hypothetical protein